MAVGQPVSDAEVVGEGMGAGGQGGPPEEASMDGDWHRGVREQPYSRWHRAGPPESGSPGFKSCPMLASCVVPGNSLHLSEPSLPLLYAT